MTAQGVVNESKIAAEDAFDRNSLVFCEILPVVGFLVLIFAFSGFMGLIQMVGVAREFVQAM